MHLATYAPYDPAVHGPDGPEGHFIVDNVWSLRESMRSVPQRRATRHHLEVGLVRLTSTGNYATCILCTFYLRILQRAVRRR
jgi:hypothetical protein